MICDGMCLCNSSCVFHPCAIAIENNTQIIIHHPNSWEILYVVSVILHTCIWWCLQCLGQDRVLSLSYYHRWTGTPPASLWSGPPTPGQRTPGTPDRAGTGGAPACPSTGAVGAVVGPGQQSTGPGRKTGSVKSRHNSVRKLWQNTTAKCNVFKFFFFKFFFTPWYIIRYRNTGLILPKIILMTTTIDLCIYF